MFKKILSITLLIISSLVLAVSVVFCVYSVIDINSILNKLANDPSASGIDYFGVGWVYGICLLALSVFGLFLSIISKKILHRKVLQYFSVIEIIVFMLLLITSIFLFYM